MGHSTTVTHFYPFNQAMLYIIFGFLNQCCIATMFRSAIYEALERYRNWNLLLPPPDSPPLRFRSTRGIVYCVLHCAVTKWLQRHGRLYICVYHKVQIIYELYLCIVHICRNKMPAVLEDTKYRHFVFSTSVCFHVLNLYLNQFQLILFAIEVTIQLHKFKKQ